MRLRRVAAHAGPRFPLNVRRHFPQFVEGLVQMKKNGFENRQFRARRFELAIGEAPVENC
ncbi:MAG: hypothetical protein D6761_10645 [Candidatus Dadabacteria bacterium]|nr:MAG: hypothetical protein D6761_10645 [Candidatus Dadabacteria bacterium]